MRTTQHLRLSFLAALASISALTGCSTLPTQPTAGAPPSGQSGPEFVQARPVAGGLSAESAAPLQGSGAVNGTTGGSVTVGRFTLLVPSGAFVGTRTFTITVPNPDVLVCDLGASGTGSFVKPLRLVLDWNATNVSDPAQLQIVWRIESSVTSTWAPTATTIDAGLQTATTELMEITDYGLVEAKAGW